MMAPGKQRRYCGRMLSVGARVGTFFALAAATLATPVLAADSAYTSVDVAGCAAEPADPADPVQSGAWICAGYGGMPVRVVEGDLRYLISFGDNAAEEIAAGQTLPPFNTIGPTMEWRIESGRPFAAILRYFTARDMGEEHQFLVVWRVGEPGAIRMVAYVSATANPDANALAREAADTRAPGFRCGIDEAGFYGNPGDGF